MRSVCQSELGGDHINVCCIRHLAVLTLVLICSSCVIPVPHRRVQRRGLEGWVTDAQTGKPIAGAKIQIRKKSQSPESDQEFETVAVSGRNGRFRQKSDYSWHGAYLFGPISYSLFPYFDMAYPGAATGRVSAMGYQSLAVHYHPWQQDDGKEAAVPPEGLKIRMQPLQRGAQ